MLAADNGAFAQAAVRDFVDITIGGLLSVLASHKDKSLVFFYGGKTVQPGYHVTEVKAGQFAALDCGANPEVMDRNIRPAIGRERRPHAYAGRKILGHHPKGHGACRTRPHGEADVRGK